MRLHRRRLIKYAAPVVAVELNRAHDGPVPATGAGQQLELDHAGAVRGVSAERARHRVRLLLDPAVPDPGELPDGGSSAGRWHVDVDGVRLTGGAWSMARTAGVVRIALDVEEPWKPGRLPWLMRLVTTAVAVFRRWPTTYRWRAQVRVEEGPSMTARSERTAPITGAATAGRPAPDRGDSMGDTPRVRAHDAASDLSGG